LVFACIPTIGALAMFSVIIPVTLSSILLAKAIVSKTSIKIALIGLLIAFASFGVAYWTLIHIQFTMTGGNTDTLIIKH
jgi:hypothetical protein